MWRYSEQGIVRNCIYVNCAIKKIIRSIATCENREFGDAVVLQQEVREAILTLKTGKSPDIYSFL